MSRRLTPEEEAYAAELSAWAEGDIEISGDAEAYVGAEAERMSRARLRGRPTLGGARGPSPKRQVRLTPELDRALQDRAAAEHRSTSDVLRAALAAYLKTS